MYLLGLRHNNCLIRQKSIGTLAQSGESNIPRPVASADLKKYTGAKLSRLILNPPNGTVEVMWLAHLMCIKALDHRVRKRI